MDQKSWLWRKKSSEKSIVIRDKTDLSLKENEGQKEVTLESLVRHLNNKLDSVLCESNAKDDLVASHAKMAQEAVAGREKAEAEAVLLQQQLNEALLQKVSTNEQMTHLTSALKDYEQQLSSVREEQEQKVHDAVTSTSREFEKAQKELEEKLTKTNKMLSNLMVENSNLNKALLLKENVIEDLTRSKSQVEEESNTLMARLDSKDKENAFLKYEFRMLEKELEIRQEEVEFNRRSADASHKQYLDSIKKVSKLEAECQRLRVQVRKRLSGPAALTKTRSEVEINGRNHTDMRRRNMNPTTGALVVRDSSVKASESPGEKNLNLLVERLCVVEEENKILKEFLAQRDDELSTLRSSFVQTASKLSQVESQNCRHEELKNTSECKMIGVSDMSLMDDFVEMEKLAIVAVDAPLESSHIFSEASSLKKSCEHQLVITGKELVPVESELETRDLSPKSSFWLEDVLKVIWEQHRVSSKCLDELLEEVRVALFKHSEQPELLPISGYLTWKTPTSSPRMECLKKMSDIGIFVDNNESLSNELKNVKTQVKDLEVLQLDNDRTDGLMNKLRESEETIESLQTELETLKESKRVIEDEMEHQKLITEELDTQLTVSNLNFNKLLKKFSSLEVELEARSHCCEELEATCLELGLQLESVTSKELPKENIDTEKKLLQPDWEITTASAKLAECQETIFNLGKQLKALSSRKEAAEFNKIIVPTANATNPNSKLKNQRSSLRDHMLAEDSAEPENLESPKTKEVISTEKPHIFHPENHNVHIAAKYRYLARKGEVLSPEVGALAIVPSKKNVAGNSLLMKLFLRKKRGNRKKRSVSFST